MNDLGGSTPPSKVTDKAWIGFEFVLVSASNKEIAKWIVESLPANDASDLAIEILIEIKNEHFLTKYIKDE